MGIFRFFGMRSKKKQNLDEGALDWLQGGLDIVGLIPGIGEAADGVNAVISLGRGNPLEALLSAISMVPGAGDMVGKSGKVILKTLNPVMDAIKASKPAVDIIKKIGPEKIKKIKPMLLKVKKVVVKEAPKIKEIFAAVKKNDLDKLEKLLDIKIPAIARGKVESAVKKVAGKLPEQDISSIFDFISNMPLDEETEISESLNHGNSLRLAMLDDRYLNEQFIKVGNEIQSIIKSGENDAL